LEWSLVDQSPKQSETEWLCVDVAGYKIVNVYKPPRSRLTPTTIATFPHPSLYVGDFNCQHVNWGYNTTYPNDESLDSWATSNNLGLLYNTKETASLFSRRQHIGNSQFNRPHHGLHGLTVLDDETIKWPLNTCPDI